MNYPLNTGLCCAEKRWLRVKPIEMSGGYLCGSAGDRLQHVEWVGVAGENDGIYCAC